MGSLIQIQMSQSTVDGLRTSGYSLYALKAVQGAFGGAPTVWFKTSNFSTVTQVVWQDAYQAYTSRSQITPNAQIVPAARYDIGLAQTLDVTSSTGTGTVADSGVTGAISIRNETTTQLTCGIMQQVADGTFGPVCACPLNGNGMDVIAPIAQVLLMITTAQVNTGTAVYQAYAPALLVDLTGVNARTVSYDLYKGWGWGGGSWAAVYPAGGNIVPLLIRGWTSLEE